MNWTNTAERMPPEGATIMAKSTSGMQHALKRRGNLWFLPDDGTYLYDYSQVVMWRYLEREEY